MRFPELTNQQVLITGVYPTDGRKRIQLMLPRWTPGYYRIENYADQVLELTAIGSAGRVLPVTRSQTNRWLIEAGTNKTVTVVYRLRCAGHSVTTDWVEADYAVFNGGATFPALVETVRRPYHVRLELPAAWGLAVTALPEVSGSTNEFRAENYDVLVDSPILAGKLRTQTTTVAGVPHVIAVAGAYAQWDLDTATRQLHRLVTELHSFWGVLPFERFVVLDVFRPGGGGLEHKNSMLLTSTPGQSKVLTDWVDFVCHEYFHAFNVKRLRPVELSKLDYEHPPHTGGLWISEGMTTYYGELLPCRAGISSPGDFLGFLSASIERLQNSPGRFVQSLETASLEVWNTPTSGLARDTSTNTISYYTKGPIVAFLLDTHIRRLTQEQRSLDDLMRLAYQRYSGSRGFTAREFCRTAEEVAQARLGDWIKANVSCPGELDYSEALAWYGLRFAPATGDKQWQLETSPTATPEQQAHWQNLFRSAGPGPAKSAPGVKPHS
ncbi:MAG: hypothetical protein QM813_10275 [Verrucomicrobiota bacterium]